MAKAVTYYGTGRRKSSVARVFMTPGKGNITVNGKSLDEYFGLETLKRIVLQPLAATGTADQFDVKVTVKEGFLTRDSRMKERKKYGLKAARRAPQFSKR